MSSDASHPTRPSQDDTPGAIGSVTHNEVPHLPGEEPPHESVHLDLSALPPEEREQAWLKHIYQGDRMPQLTLRAVVTGSILGMLMSLSNLYVGLKIGWSLGVAITACILSYSLFKVLTMIFGVKPMSILENNCMQSTASSAGYSTGGTMVAGISAYVMLTHQHMDWPILTLWTIFLAGVGVFIAVPMKRQMIDVEQLRFPSGVAAAETLRSLHSEGREAVLKARGLTLAAIGAGLWKLIVDQLGRVPRLKGTFWEEGAIGLPFNLGGLPAGQWTVSLDLSLIMVAAGAIMGFKVAWSMLFGAIIAWCCLAPWMVSLGAIHHVAYRDIVSWTTWTGTAIMVTSSLLLFALQWKTVLRALSGLTAIFTGKSADSQELAAIEVPGSWFLWGFGLSGLGCVAILHWNFGTTLFVGVVAVLLSAVLSLVACRATGESDITPMGAMGKMAQLTFAILAPSNMYTNLMTANVTAGAASSSADLLTDLKSGYLLGANPRKQFIAQFLGIFAGTLIVVPAYYVLVPDPNMLGGQQWPAPAAQVWRKVAEILSQGVSSLHWTAQCGLVVGGIVGILLPLFEMAAPARFRPYIPSATGVGLAFVIPFMNSLSMFLGALLAWCIERWAPKVSEYVVPVSSGIIAGESLTGVALALQMSLPGLLAKLLGH